jgi:hypothetical protein
MSEMGSDGPLRVQRAEINQPSVRPSFSLTTSPRWHLAVINEPATLMQHATLIALLIRVAIALATRTFFQPDEYFQALEPAHFLVFGYGHLTWEWTSNPPIRSILYPALNVPIYWLLKVFHLDETFLLVRWFPNFF